MTGPIYWDPASVRVQIGLLDPSGLPVAGIETAKKLLDEQRPSNTLMGKWADSADNLNGTSRLTRTRYLWKPRFLKSASV